MILDPNQKRGKGRPKKHEQRPQARIDVVLPCVHAPWHDEKLLDGICQFLSYLGSRLGSVTFNGDFLDLNSLSAHDRGQVPMAGVDLQWEYNQTNKLIDKIQKSIKAKNVELNYLYGNHEDRYLRHMKLVDNSKYGKALLSPEDGLHLIDRGFEVKTKWREDYFALGDHLQVIHGEYCGQNPSRAHLSKLKQSVMFAHTHRIGYEFDGKMMAVNIGMLGDIQAPIFKYASRAERVRWQNGFGINCTDEEGDFHAHAIPCHNGHFYYNGLKF
jgi:hypothetical protein